MSPNFFVSTLIIWLSFLSTPYLPSAEETSLYGGCTQEKYTQNSPYQSNINSLLTSLVNSATYSSYNNFTIMGQDRIFGLYQCRGDLAMPDCATCVARAVSQLGELCSQTCGGAVQLQGCYVKYDNSSFLGVEDKTVSLKKCGPSIGYDLDAMGRRDSVLAALLSTGGLYRVGGSGNVQGLAQCVGDLNGGECQDCVTEAIRRLKSDCGTADYGDMFLAKCYARYSTEGGHSYYKAHNDKWSNDDGEKTFAIVIGLLAGVALLIIFLIFVRKICEGNGK